MPSKNFLHFIAFVIRCTASAVIGYSLALEIGLPWPLWTSISAIVVSQEQYTETRVTVIRRTIGTICGVCIAVAVNAVALPLHIGMWQQMAITVTLSAILAYGRPAMRAALWTCPIVLLTANPGESILMVGFYRGCEVILGGFLGGILHALSDRLLKFLDSMIDPHTPAGGAIEE